MQNITHYKSSVVQGDNHGTINNIFEKVDISTIENWVRELNDEKQDKKTLHLIVLASTRQNYQTIKNAQIPLENYGNHSENWKPFKDEPEIKEILQEFKQKSGLLLALSFIDNVYSEDELWQQEIRSDIAKNYILIVDFLSLLFENNKKFALLFDRDEVGGFLVPFCASLHQNHKQNIHNTFQEFKDLRVCWKQKFNKPYMFIDLEVANKFLLFRRLADIAYKHLGKEIAKVTKLKVENLPSDKNTKIEDL